MTELSKPGRLFQWWDYNPTHQKLLLRSQKEDRDRTHETRIDVLFWSVSFCQLPTVMQGLEIVAGQNEEYSRRRYLLKHSQGEGFVVASDIQWTEDFGEFDEPTTLG